MAAIALCMFISAQTENQIIAAIGGFASILVVLSLNSIASVVSFAPLKQLLTSISFYSRYYDLTIGMINAAGSVFLLQLCCGILLPDDKSSGEEKMERKVVVYAKGDRYE